MTVASSVDVERFRWKLGHFKTCRVSQRHCHARRKIARPHFFRNQRLLNMKDAVMNETEDALLDTRSLLHCKNGSQVIPGDRLGRTVVSKEASKNDDSRQIRLISGPGTYDRGGSIFASVVGSVSVSLEASLIKTEERNPATSVHTTATSSSQIVIVSVIPKSGAFRAMQQVIRPDQTVLARVIRITSQQQVLVEIVANPFGRLDSPACGGIRRDDILSSTALASSLSTTTASPQPTLMQQQQPLTQYFRQGDWIVARVVSLGDDAGGWYSLSTAQPSLGVIHALSSASGQPMIPISNKEMECPVTGQKEARKCARPPMIPPVLKT
jgi:exosome complex RNA-binding protein Csl4